MSTCPWIIRLHIEVSQTCNIGAVGVRRGFDAHVFRTAQVRKPIRVEGHVRKNGHMGIEKISKFIAQPACADSNQLVSERIIGRIRPSRFPSYYGVSRWRE